MTARLSRLGRLLGAGPARVPGESAPPGAEPRAPAEGRIVTLIGRAGCHLCDDALAVIERVAGDLGAAVEVRDLDAEPPHVRDDYWEKIPVVLVDGAHHDFWRVDEQRLRAALTAHG